MFANMRYSKRFFVVLFLWSGLVIFGQEDKTSFWKQVQFGGGVGATFGNSFTNVMLAPAALYNFNEYVGVGVGLTGSYVRVRNEFSSYLYGGSLLGVFRPAPEVQLSAELEQLWVNSETEVFGEESSRDNFWNTALFIGAGFSNGPVTVGLRYNLLHQNDSRVYPTAYMPFVRVFF